MKKPLITTACLFCLLPLQLVFAFPYINSNNDLDLVTTFVTQTQDLRPAVVKAALTAYNKAQEQGIEDQKQIITIIDYSLPSSEKRLWVLDLKTKEVLFHTYVAHGKNSGTNYANHFSNDPQSLQSSIGLYVTKGTYVGGDGYSLILSGLEKGFNDKAEARHIIIHGAPYVSQNTVDNQGRVGRSWGCPAVSQKLAKPIINAIKNGTLLLAYYPDTDWLNGSEYL